MPTQSNYYTDQQKQDWLQLAQEIGVGPAITELGYPKSQSTAHAWLRAFNVTITLDTLKQKAANIKEFYGYREQMTVLQANLERIQEKLSDAELSPDDIKKLSEAANKTITTMELIAGRATNRNASIDPLNDQFVQLLNEARDNNDRAREQLEKEFSPQP